MLPGRTENTVKNRSVGTIPPFDCLFLRWNSSTMRKWLRDNNLAPGTGRAKGGSMVVTLDEITGQPEILSSPQTLGSPAFSNDHCSDTSTPRNNGRSTSVNSNRSEKQMMQDPTPKPASKPVCRMPAHLRPPSINLDLPDTSQQGGYQSIFDNSTLGSPSFGGGLGTPLGLWKSSYGDTAMEDSFFEEILKSGNMFSPRGFLTPHAASAPQSSITTVDTSPKEYPGTSIGIGTHQIQLSPTSGSVPIKQKLKASSPHYHHNQQSKSTQSPSESSQRMPPPASPQLSPTSRAMNILLPLLHRHQQTIVSQLGESHDRVPLQMLPYFKFLNESAQRFGLLTFMKSDESFRSLMSQLIERFQRTSYTPRYVSLATPREGLVPLVLVLLLCRTHEWSWCPGVC